MAEQLIFAFKVLWWILRRNLRRIVWNLFLAFIPLALSYWLFRGRRSRSFTWWLGFVAFLAFLPNAPYILTDIIHLIYDVRAVSSVWVVTLVVFPLHLLFIASGFEAYVLSLLNMGYYLHRIGKTQWILAAELIAHALCAVGIYLGRFPRFNTWDIVTQPDALVETVIDDLTGKRPLVVIFLTFMITTALYWLVKQVTLAIVLQRDASIFPQHDRNKSNFSKMKS